MVEAGCSAAQHRQRLIDIQALRVSRKNISIGVDFFDTVVSIIEIVRGRCCWRICSRRVGLLNATTEWIVPEAKDVGSGLTRFVIDEALHEQGGNCLSGCTMDSSRWFAVCWFS